MLSCSVLSADGVEKSSNVMVEPWSGRVLNCGPDGPVARFERAKNARKGSWEPM